MYGECAGMSWAGFCGLLGNLLQGTPRGLCVIFQAWVTGSVGFYIKGASLDWAGLCGALGLGTPGRGGSGACLFSSLRNQLIVFYN